MSAHNGGVPTPSPPTPSPPAPHSEGCCSAGRPAQHDGVTTHTRPLHPLGLQAQLRAGREAAGPVAPEGHPGTPEASLAFQGQTQTCVPAQPTPQRLPGWSTVTCAPHTQSPPCQHLCESEQTAHSRDPFAERRLPAYWTHWPGGWAGGIGGRGRSVRESATSPRLP